MKPDSSPKCWKPGPATGSFVSHSAFTDMLQQPKLVKQIWIDHKLQNCCMGLSLSPGLRAVCNTACKQEELATHCKWLQGGLVWDDQHVVLQLSTLSVVND